MEIPQITQAVAKTKGGSPQTDNRTRLPRTMTTQLNAWRISAAACILKSLVLEGTLQMTEREMCTPTLPQNFGPIICHACKIC